MIPLFKVKMSPKVTESLDPVLQSGYIGQGPKVEEFEDELQKVLGTTVRPVTVNSCTTAIDLALELCGVGPGDEVISTPQTCFASQVGAIHRYAKIRWADIDPLTGLIDPVKVGELVTEKTKAIIAVNWAGKYADYKALKQFGIPVIEDAAHTWDVFPHVKPERGDYICYSFQAIKYLTTSDGGLLVTPPEKELEARLLRWYGLDRTKNESFRCTQNITKAGFKYHMNDVCATIGLVNIPEAFESVTKQKANAKKLIEDFQDLEFAYVAPYEEEHSYWLFPIIMKEGYDREKFVEYLNEKGIGNSPVHFRNDTYDSTIMFHEGVLPVTDVFTTRQTNIPCGWWLTEEELEYISSTIRAYK